MPDDRPCHHGTGCRLSVTWFGAKVRGPRQIHAREAAKDAGATNETEIDFDRFECFELFGGRYVE
jgi:hypothetical protein